MTKFNMIKVTSVMLMAVAMLACTALPEVIADAQLAKGGNVRSLLGPGFGHGPHPAIGHGHYPDFDAGFAQAQAAAQAVSGAGGYGYQPYGPAYPTYNECQAAASAFATASSSSGGRRRLQNWRDSFSNAFAQANAQAGAAGFGGPAWRGYFTDACAAQASAAANAGSFSGGGRKLKSYGGKLPSFNDASFAQAQAAAQAASGSSGGGYGYYPTGSAYPTGPAYPNYNECQAAASAFATAGSSSGGRRRLQNWRDSFSSAFAQANAQAGATGFGGPAWKGYFTDACSAQASAQASASSFSSSGK